MRAKLLTFVFGIVVGAVGAIFLPPLVGPMLPAGLRSEGDAVDGVVVRRQRDQERLLLTINTAQGAALATFTERVAEIDLLITEGDTVTLGLGAYEPFVDNPPIRAVRKAEPGEPAAPVAARAPVGSVPPAATGEPPVGSAEPADEGPADDAPGAEAELEEWPGDGGDGG